VNYYKQLALGTLPQIPNFVTFYETVKGDIAAKRHPGEIDSVFHWAGKMHKNNNLHIGISNSYGRQKFKFGLFTNLSSVKGK
jgi:hypothetical protein